MKGGARMLGRIFGRKGRKWAGSERVKGYVEFRGGSFWFVAYETHQTYPVGENQFPGIRAGEFAATVQDGTVLTLERLESER